MLLLMDNTCSSITAQSPSSLPLLLMLLLLLLQQLMLLLVNNTCSSTTAQPPSSLLLLFLLLLLVNNTCSSTQEQCQALKPTVGDAAAQQQQLLPHAMHLLGACMDHELLLQFLLTCQ
jgi:hypothetical protein